MLYFRGRPRPGFTALGWSEVMVCRKKKVVAENTCVTLTLIFQFTNLNSTNPITHGCFLHNSCACHPTRKDIKLADQIRAFESILESFGHAETAANPSALQFTRRTELHFNDKGVS